jgi:hypothetical protein
MEPTDWLYPINPAGKYALTSTGTGVETEVSREALLADLERNPGAVDPWILNRGFRIMGPGDRVWIYATRPHQAICALATAVRVYQDKKGLWQVDLSWDLAATRTLMAEPIPRSRFGQIPQVAAVRADATTRRVLAEWLGNHGGI